MDFLLSKGKYLILIIMCLFFPKQLQAQYYNNISQYMFEGILYNPGYTGSRNALSISLMHRNQWVGIDGAPTSFFASAHSPMRNKRVALGLTMMAENYGLHSQKESFFSYAYRFPLLKGTIAFGIRAGVNAINMNWQGVQTITGNDPAFQNPSTSFLMPNTGFGFYYTHAKFFMGAAVPSMFLYKENNSRNGYSFYHDYNQYNIFSTLGLVLPISSKVIFQPSVLVKYQKESSYQYDINGLLYFKNLCWIGLAYRMEESMVAMFRYEVNQQMRIGYAYDYAIGELANVHSGTHEILIQYEFAYLVKAITPRF